MVVLEFPVLHTEFQGRRSTDSGEEDFQRFLPYMSVVAILVMLSERFEQIFVWRLKMKFGYNLLNGFRGDVRNCHTMNVLGQRSNNDLDLLCSQNFVYSLRQLNNQL